MNQWENQKQSWENAGNQIHLRDRVGESFLFNPNKKHIKAILDDFRHSFAFVTWLEKSFL